MHVEKMEEQPGDHKNESHETDETAPSARSSVPWNSVTGADRADEQDYAENDFHDPQYSGYGSDVANVQMYTTPCDRGRRGRRGVGGMRLGKIRHVWNERDCKVIFLELTPIAKNTKSKNVMASTRTISN